MMDAITYQYLIGFSLGYRLVKHQLDVVTAYCSGLLDTNIYMKALLKLIINQLNIYIFNTQGEHTHSTSIFLSNITHKP
jgi:hypothetical protein